MACTARSVRSMGESRFYVIHLSISLTYLGSSRACRRFVRSEEGRKVQVKVFEQISRKLENIQPGMLKTIPFSQQI